MGHSERVVESNARARQAREWDALMRAHKPDGLTQQEVGLVDHPLTKAPTARPVSAWVRYAGKPVRVKGFTAMWTDTAAKVRWVPPQGGWHEAWVWEGAVEPRQMTPSEQNLVRLGLSVNGAEEQSYPTGFGKR